MTLIADVFAKLRTSKNTVRKLSKNSRFREPFHKQHGEWVQKPLKSEWQHVYHMYWLLRRQLNWRKFLLEIFKILKLFVKILTAHDKYSLLNRDNLTEAIQILLSEKQKASSQFFFFCIFDIKIKFWRFSKKKWVSYLMYFQNYLLWKTCLDKCLKILFQRTVQQASW